MKGGLELFSPQFLTESAVRDVLRCNDDTFAYGLTLTKEQAVDLVETRSRALRDNGLVEIGGGVLGKLLRAFRDSPYLAPQTYAETINQIAEVYYAYRRVSFGKYSDDELIAFLREWYDEPCQGSLELLGGTALQWFIDTMRKGKRPDALDLQDELYGDTNWGGSYRICRRRR